MDLSVVLTSAAVSAVVSGLFTFVSQLLERQARRRELLMRTATDLAVKHLEEGIHLALDAGKRPDIPPLGMLVYEFQRQLTSVMKHGILPPEEQNAYDNWLKR